MVRTGIPGYSGDLSGGSSDGGGSSSGSSSTTTPTSGTDRSGESTFDSGPDPADEYGQELGGDPAESGGRNTSSGGSSGGTTERVTARVNRSSGGVGGTVDTGVDAARDVFSDVQSGVGRVSDALPGRTGTAFTAGVGLAAVPEPTPVTEVSGAAIAGGAALVGGGILASRALRRRSGEIGVGERTRSEVEVGQSRQDVTEVGVGGSQTTTEIEPGATGPSTTEIGIGATRGRPEVDISTGDSQTGGPSINVAQQLGIGQQSGQQIGREEETFTIGRNTIDDVERTDELEEEERMRQIRDQLERRQEFVREDTPGRGLNRDPVRFPAEEAATGTTTGLGEQLEPDLDINPEGALATGVGAAGTTPDFFGGGERASDDVAGTGIEPSSGSGLLPEAGTGTGGASTFEADTTTDVGSGTGTGTGTGGDVGQEILTDTTTVTQTTTAQAQSQALGEATPQAFAQPTEAVFETQVVEPTGAGSGIGQGTPPRRPRDIPEAEGSDDSPTTVLDTSEDEFGSGILGGSVAAKSVFGDMRF